MTKNKTKRENPQLKQKIKCEICDEEVSYRHMARHKKSDRHLELQALTNKKTLAVASAVSAVLMALSYEQQIIYAKRRRKNKWDRCREMYVGFGIEAGDEERAKAMLGIGWDNLDAVLNFEALASKGSWGLSITAVCKILKVFKMPVHARDYSDLNVTTREHGNWIQDGLEDGAEAFLTKVETTIEWNQRFRFLEDMAIKYATPFKQKCKEKGEDITEEDMQAEETAQDMIYEVYEMGDNLFKTMNPKLLDALEDKLFYLWMSEL
ncbi:MAG: hypothetical protein GY861_10670 [bacterium]|nr:hypothetical protein [bacterium]